MEQSSQKFPLRAEDYKLCEEVGEGVSATVYKALCIPRNETVAIKVLDLEKCNNDLDGIRREVQTMILINHPNLLRAHCSFATGHHLWVVMPYMAGGSCLHIMKTSFPEGFDEPVIATILREVLKALIYLHEQGHIHRDVKAGNILVDSNGSVKLADFGVAACMFDTGDRQRARNTFVGTPCWMAPEVMQQLHGYDFKADIWSFGITALELAHGHAPFSKYPPMKVLLMTLQNAPPGLDYERDKRFSKAFKELVAVCLVKDPKKRPSAEKLLKHAFFKHARPVEYLSRTILNGLPSLGERFRILKEKEADILLQNKALYEDKDHLSQQEYIRGISAWNFNLEDLKNQAALIQEDTISNQDGVGSPVGTGDRNEVNHSNEASQLENGLDDIDDLETSLAAFPMKPLQALKGCFDVCEAEDDTGEGSSSSRGSNHSDLDSKSHRQSLTNAVDRETGRGHTGDSGPGVYMSNSSALGRKKSTSGSLLQENVLSPRKFISDGDREHLQPRFQNERNNSGPLQHRQKKDVGNYTAGEDASEGAVVERRGRFKVTSGDLSPKAPANSNLHHGGSTSQTNSGVPVAAVLPSLNFILQQNVTIREGMLKLLRLADPSPGVSNEAGMNSLLQMDERELQEMVIWMQQRIGSLVEDLNRVKAKNAQLERKLNAMIQKENSIQE